MPMTHFFKLAGKRTQFGLRSLLISVTVAAVWLAHESNRATGMRDAVAKIQAAGGNGHYTERTSFGYPSLQRCIGDDYFRRLNRVNFVGPEPPGTITISCGFPTGKPNLFLSFSGIGPTTEFTDDTLGCLLPLDIEDLYLERVPITNEGMKYIGQLTTLKWLHLKELDISDDAIVHLRNLRQIELIDFSGTVLSDRALVHLRTLANLQRLYLNGSVITDDGIQNLACLRQLEWLYLGNTKVTAGGAARLKEFAPRIKEIYY